MTTAATRPAGRIRSRSPGDLFALVAGRLEALRDTIVLKDGRTASLEVWVEPQDIDKTQHTMDSLKKSIRWDEERWGLELDLDGFRIVATNDFNFGAMENKGLNIFNARYALANPKVATDQDYANIESVVGHSTSTIGRATVSRSATGSNSRSRRA